MRSYQGGPLPPGTPLPPLLLKDILPLPLIPNEGLPWQNEDVAWELCDCKVVTMACTLPIRASNSCCCFLSFLVKASLYEGELTVYSGSSNLHFPLRFKLTHPILIFSPPAFFQGGHIVNCCVSMPILDTISYPLLASMEQSVF